MLTSLESAPAMLDTSQPVSSLDTGQPHNLLSSTLDAHGRPFNFAEAKYELSSLIDNLIRNIQVSTPLQPHRVCGDVLRA